jgi:hypothetical protein
MNRASFQTLAKALKQPVIGKYLDISTKHISKKDSHLLDRTVGSNPLIVIKYDEGYFVHVDSETKYFHQTLTEARKFGYSKDLITILRWARSKKCWFVRLDADGTTYSDLPTFEW